MGNKLFGTDGVRGVANQYPMTIKFAMNLAQACAVLVCKDKKKVAIAKDTRISGDMLEAALTAGFTAQGVDVLKLGILPTPALTTVTDSLGVDMSVMITASHNPFHDNGIKLIDAKGNKFSDKVTAEVEDLIMKGEFSGNPDTIGRVLQNDEALDCYLALVKSICNGAEQPLKGLKMVVDCANGAFSKIMPQLFMSLGAGVISLAHEPDGYNINKDCGSQHVEKMLETVRGAHAHIGIACDGDGDRIIVCDENGSKIPSEQLIAFLARYMKENGMLKGRPVVSTILSNTGLDSFVAGLGVDYYATKVGERYIIEKMQETGGAVGGEESGHIVLGDYSKTGDALVVGLFLCLGLVKSGKKMSALFPGFAFDPFVFENIRFSNNEAVREVVADEQVKAVVEKAKKVIEGQGRVVFRPSGTEPLVRIWVGGKNEAQVQALSAEIINTVLSVKKQ